MPDDDPSCGGGGDGSGSVGDEMTQRKRRVPSARLELPLLARKAIQCCVRLVSVASFPLGTLLLFVLDLLQKLNLRKTKWIIG